MSFSNTVKRAWNDNRLMSALIELTYACNLNCVFCYNDLSLTGTPLSLQQYRTLLEDLAAMSVLNVSLSGGEPLAHPEFYQIGAYARELGFVIRIKTNGHAVKEPVARRIQREIDPFLIEVSLHGGVAETHDRQTRVPGSFDRLVENIRAMTAMGLRVKVNSVLTRWNEAEVEAMLTLCESLGVRIQIDPEVKPRDDGDREPLGLIASSDGRARHLELLRARAAAKEAAHGERPDKDTASISEAAEGSPAEARRALFAGTDKHCGAGSSTLTVDPYGNVLPCVQWRRSVGSLHEQRVHEIWAGSTGLREVRETTQQVARELGALGDDTIATNFCPGLAHTYGGDPLALYATVKQPRPQGTRELNRLPVL